MALSTARIQRVRGRPPLLAAGIKSLIHSHSSSVRSLGYIVSFITPCYTTHEDFSDRLLGLLTTVKPPALRGRYDCTRGPGWLRACLGRAWWPLQGCWQSQPPFSGSREQPGHDGMHVLERRRDSRACGQQEVPPRSCAGKSVLMARQVRPALPDPGYRRGRCFTDV